MKIRAITLSIGVFVLAGFIFAFVNFNSPVLAEVKATQPNQAMTAEEMQAAIIELSAKVEELQSMIAELSNLVRSQNTQNTIAQPSLPVSNELERNANQTPFQSVPFNRFGNVSNGVNLTMAGLSYNADLTFGTGGSGQTFTLNGNFTSISGVIGPVDGIDGRRATISFSGDGNVIEIFRFAHGDPVREFSIDLTGVTELTISNMSQLSGLTAADAESSLQIALANIILR